MFKSFIKIFFFTVLGCVTLFLIINLLQKNTKTSNTAITQHNYSGPALCPDPLPADWIFCEDFENNPKLNDIFFEYDNDEGEFIIVNTEAASGMHSMQVNWQKDEVDAGRFNIAFGKNPIVYSNKPHFRANEKFVEIFWRMRVKHQTGWPDIGPDKLSRVTIIAKKNWGQAMIAHIWSDNLTLTADPASCVTGPTVNCVVYNDFDNLDWLGQMPGKFELFSSSNSGQWHCIEGHVQLNSPGQNDGLFEFWVDDILQNSRNDINWRNTFDSYGINMAFFENYWNKGATKDLNRWFDDIAIATTRIGCN